MHYSILYAFFIALQATFVRALPPQVQIASESMSAFFTPSNSIDGWPSSTKTASIIIVSGWSRRGSSTISYSTTEATSVTAATTVTVTNTLTPTSSISGWPSSSSNAQSVSVLKLTETFTVTYTSYAEETITLLPGAFTTDLGTQSTTYPYTVVTVTGSATGKPSYTIVTVTATQTPRFTTITVSEVTLWPTPAPSQSSTPTSQPTSQSDSQPPSQLASQTESQPTSQLVTLTLTSSSVNWSLNSTAVLYSSTIMTLNQPASLATATATVGVVGRHV
ncbi:hypothetical protein GGS21DRAFT_549060 [Xylaria nigripes]|nr:hypothetical protein GGS21DRAFT_549060 [Xylaria nigripes]